MAGILDPKSRFLDVFITNEGRRQLANGGFDIRYYTFSDIGTSYDADVASGSADPGGKIYLEGSNLPQDSITFEANDSGNVIQSPPIPYATNSNNSSAFATISSYVRDGGIYQLRVSGSVSQLLSLTGSAFASTSEQLFSGFLTNFQNNQIIGSNDSIFDDTEFNVTPRNLNFSTPASTQQKIKIDLSDSFWSDAKVSHLKNFMYLPPKNSDGTSLGNYTPKTPLTSYDIKQILSELSDKPKNNIRFSPTSRKNNIAMQFFEASNSKLKKLDVIDYGLHQLNGQFVRVAFIGKIFFDSNNDPKFINLFTAIFRS